MIDPKDGNPLVRVMWTTCRRRRVSTLLGGPNYSLSLADGHSGRPHTVDFGDTRLQNKCPNWIASDLRLLLIPEVMCTIPYVFGLVGSIRRRPFCRFAFQRRGFSWERCKWTVKHLEVRPATWGFFHKYGTGPSRVSCKPRSGCKAGDLRGLGFFMIINTWYHMQSLFIVWFIV